MNMSEVSMTLFSAGISWGEKEMVSMPPPKTCRYLTSR